MANNLALEIHNLCYSYKNEWTRKTISGLKDITVDIESGESFGFLGHNGSGKTTTMKAILGFIKPSSGEIKIYGAKSSTKEALKVVGYIAEQPYFYDYLTVKESLELYGTLSGISAKDLKDKVLYVSETVKIADRLDSRLRSLSKGLTQRVALAQAIINNPKLLLLDEPFSGLDPVGRAEFRDIFLRLKKNGTTLFISSHILSDVEVLCDRASILVKGEIKGIYDLKNLSNSKNCHYDIAVEKSIFEKIGTILNNLSFVKEDRNNISVIRFNNEEPALHALKKILESNEKPLFYEKILPRLEDIFLEAVK